MNFKKTIICSLGLILTGCATTNWDGPGTTADFSKAKAYCEVQTSKIMGVRGSNSRPVKQGKMVGDVYVPSYDGIAVIGEAMIEVTARNNYIKDCLISEGYIIAKNGRFN